MVARKHLLVYSEHMKKQDSVEKPLPLGARVYEKHRKIIKKWSKRYKISDAEVVRRALQEFDINRISLAEQ